MVNVLVNSLGKIYTDSTGKALSVSSGGSATLITKTITENGTYNASSDSADGYSSVTVNVSGGSSGSSITAPVPLTRFKDDTNTEIGTHYMNFVDGSNNVYKVILLDAQYRNADTEWASIPTGTAVTDLPLYSNLQSSNVWEAKETATYNTQKILDFCAANNYNSTSCSHCRSKSFTIGGVTYYGQLPNMIELIYVALRYGSFDALDSSAASYPAKNFSNPHPFWSSNQQDTINGWILNGNGHIEQFDRDTSQFFTSPVLEIPVI